MVVLIFEYAVCPGGEGAALKAVGLKGLAGSNPVHGANYKPTYNQYKQKKHNSYTKPHKHNNLTKETTKEIISCRRLGVSFFYMGT